jgi:hypothetical protein
MKRSEPRGRVRDRALSGESHGAGHWSGLAALGAACLLAAAAPAPAAAQDDGDRAAVLAVLDRLFDGMRAHDGDMVRSVFAEGAVMIGTETGDGTPRTTVRPAEGFAQTVADGEGLWDEPYWDPIIHIQDHLATVWTKYAFYLSGEFSHCGIDAVILGRGPDGWKIAALADSRERENCELPPDRPGG